MIIYFYVAVLIVASIITGIIVTIIEKRGLHPKRVVAPVCEPEKVETNVAMPMEESFVLEDNPLLRYEKYVGDENLLMKTVDLSDVQQHIQKIEVSEEEIEILDDGIEVLDEELI